MTDIQRRRGPLLACAALVLVLLVAGAVGYWTVAGGEPGEPDGAKSGEAEERPVSEPKRIMLAGDSMTQGADGDRTWRYHLWNHLSPHVEGLDFVGPYDEPASSDMILPVPTAEGEDPSEQPEDGSGQDGGADGPAGQRGNGETGGADEAGEDSESGEADGNGDSGDDSRAGGDREAGGNGSGNPGLPGMAEPGEAEYGDPDFDHEHNALWGRTLQDASATIGEEVRSHRPDVLCVMLGVNDLLWPVSTEEMEQRLRDYVGAARAANPNLRVVLAEALPIALAESDDGFALRVYAYNKLVREVAADLSTEASPVISLDISGAERWEVAEDTYDGTHPNADGELKIAAAFADALSRGYGIGPGYPRPLPIAP